MNRHATHTMPVVSKKPNSNNICGVWVSVLVVVVLLSCCMGVSCRGLTQTSTSMTPLSNVNKTMNPDEIWDRIARQHRMVNERRRSDRNKLQGIVEDCKNFESLLNNQSIRTMQEAWGYVPDTVGSAALCNSVNTSEFCIVHGKNKRKPLFPPFAMSWC